MQDAIVNFVRVPMMGTHITHKPTRAAANALGTGRFGDIFKCAPGGDERLRLHLLHQRGHVAVAVRRRSGSPKWPTTSASAIASRASKNIDELTAIHRPRGPAKRTKHEVMKIMGEAGVPCGAVLDSLELLNDPHLRERGMIVDRRPSGARQVHDAGMSGASSRIRRSRSRARRCWASITPRFTAVCWA